MRWSRNGGQKKDIYVANHGALQSMSRRGNCCDNAHAESFWSRFQAELLDGGRLPGLAEAKLEISHHIAYFNAERRHSALGYWYTYCYHHNNLSGVMGRPRTRRPVAWYTALATAAEAPVTAISPAPWAPRGMCGSGISR